ncbi:hypothetical protein Hdeb2414_s0005g00156651 [Helianthus debilis subsp. tardiflorus]
MGVGVYGGVGWRLKAEKERLLRQTSDRSDRADDEDVTPSVPLKVSYFEFLKSLFINFDFNYIFFVLYES